MIEKPLISTDEMLTLAKGRQSIEDLERQAQEHHQAAMRLWSEANRLRGEESRRYQAMFNEYIARRSGA